MVVWLNSISGRMQKVVNMIYRWSNRSSCLFSALALYMCFDWSFVRSLFFCKLCTHLSSHCRFLWAREKGVCIHVAVINANIFNFSPEALHLFSLLSLNAHTVRWFKLLYPDTNKHTNFKSGVWKCKTLSVQILTE